MSKTNIVLDATMLDTFLLCPCKFNYRFNLNRVTTTKAKPLDRGGLVHVGQEEYFKALKDKKKFDERMEIAVKAMQLHSLESDMELEDISRTIDVTIESITRWKDQDETLEILDVETPFIYLLYEDDDVRIYMMGKIDLLVNQNYPARYEKIPYDHKTYERDFPVKRLVNQFCNYAYATGSNYLCVNRIGFQTSIKPEIKHKRIMLSYDHLILEQWKANVVSVTKEYIRCAAENDWPMNFTSCDKFNRLCEYHPVCDSSGMPAKEFKLHSLFNVGEKWDVSAILNKKGSE